MIEETNDLAQKFFQGNVLIIDDAEESQRMMRVILSRLGAKQLITAADICTAVELIIHEKISLIVCDYHLGANSVLDLCKELDARGLSAIPLVVITSDLTADEFQSAKRSNLANILYKPISFEDVKDKLMDLSDPDSY